MNGVSASLRLVLGFALWLPTHPLWAREYAILGDAGVWNYSTRQIRNSIEAAGVPDLVMPGDNLYDGESYDQPWAPWRSRGFRFPVVAIGNHHGGYAQEVAYFNLPGEYYAVRPEPGVLFIVLNSDHQALANNQAEFLERTLQSAQDELIFVVFHHPPVSLTKSHFWEERQAFHRAVTPVLYRHRENVTALLLGHDHIAAWYDLGGIPTFVSGAAHEFKTAPALDETQRGLRIRSRFTGVTAPQWIKLSTNVTKKMATFEFIRADTHTRTCRANIAGANSPATSDAHCQNE